MKVNHLLASYIFMGILASTSGRLVHRKLIGTPSDISWSSTENGEFVCIMSRNKKNENRTRELLSSAKLSESIVKHEYHVMMDGFVISGLNDEGLKHVLDHPELEFCEEVRNLYVHDICIWKSLV